LKTKLFLLTSLILVSAFFSSCGTDNIITQLITNEISAKQRLDSANAQAIRDHGASTKLVMIFGKNVKSNGKTEISALSLAADPSTIGAWLYIYRTSSDTNLYVYTPNPTPGASDCWELTQFFSVSTAINLIQDPAVKSIVSGALALLTTSNIGITTPQASLMDSPDSYSLSYSTNPVIKFNSSYVPSSSTNNGSTFFSTGTNQSVNMFLIPAAGTLNLPNYITTLAGFPADMWIVNYKKTDANNIDQSMTLGTVVQSSQSMTIPTVVTSKVINLSETAQ
jgi:hypothetical protein